MLSLLYSPHQMRIGASLHRDKDTPNDEYCNLNEL